MHVTFRLYNLPYYLANHLVAKRLKMKRLIAHRGMSSLAPENTLAAFSLCKEHNIQWFECDVDILKDGTIIVSHDDTLDRCTDKRWSIM